MEKAKYMEGHGDITWVGGREKEKPFTLIFNSLSLEKLLRNLNFKLPKK